MAARLTSMLASTSDVGRALLVGLGHLTAQRDKPRVDCGTCPQRCQWGEAPGAEG
jgi:hypothetical protein